MKSFVTVNNDGYIDMWSSQKVEGFIEVETAESNMNLINVCKIQSGKVVLDEKRQQEIIASQDLEKTEVEKLREELLLTQEALAALFESNLG
ncbi:TPA: hypothetical protein ACSK72_001078 [Listeria innocua]